MKEDTCMKKTLIQRIKDRFIHKTIKVHVVVTEDDLNIQYPTFEEFEEAVEKGKPFKID